MEIAAESTAGPSRRTFSTVPAFRITRTSLIWNIHRLAPFALRTVLPPSLAGRYSCDYYGACVTVGLAPRR